MAGFLWKPVSENNGKLVVLTPSELTGKLGKVYVVTPNGQRIEGKFSSVANGNRSHWRFDRPGGAFPRGSYVVGTREGGGAVRWNIGNPGGRNEGGGGQDFKDFESSMSGGGGGPITNTTPDGAMGGGSSGGAALPFGPFEFPSFPSVSFPTIDAAPYNFTQYDPLDVQEFAKKFGEFNRDELKKNFGLGQDFALQALDTELKGLKHFAPAAAALSRELTSADNAFNLKQRKEAVDTALPEAAPTFQRARNTFGAQAGRAAAYTEGRLPDRVLDNARELGLRSRAADVSTFSGIGPNSRAARKTSDLMSADARFQIAQYGEGLTAQNTGQQLDLVNREADLYLPPTSYAQTGAQVRPTPEIGAGRLAFEGFGAVNSSTLLAPATALSSTIQQDQFKAQTDVQQEQFVTSLEQRTREFNATGTFSADTFNATGMFQSSLGQFSSDVGYLSSIQEANQANLNAASNASAAAMQNNAHSSGFSGAQGSQEIASIGQAIGTIASAAGGISDLLSGSSGNSQPEAPAVSEAPPVGAISGESLAESVPQTVFAGGGGGMADATTPSSMRIAAGAEVPSGYSPVMSHSDGSRTVASVSDYQTDLERFAKFSGGGQFSTAQLSSAVKADQAVSQAAGLSYLPIQGFQPMALSSAGHQVYTMPALAQNGNTELGRDKGASAMLAANQLGVDDPALFDAIGSTARVAGDGEFHAELDNAYINEGEDAVAEAIIDRIGGKGLKEGEAKDQLTFAALRISELWPNLSPAQRSLALSSLAPMAAEAKTGKDVSKIPIPGSDRSPVGALTVGDAVNITARGSNGFALARNWNQLSALGKLTNQETPDGVAKITGHAGFLGFGPQGSSINVVPGELERIGARPAPELGVGGIVVRSESRLPRGYKAIARTPNGEVAAVPGNLLHTSSIGRSGAAGYAKAERVAARLHPAQKLWGEPPAKNAIRGSVGGSAIVSGMATLTKNNPALAGSVTSYSLFNNTFGKDGEA